jgi:multiple sugar transport system ATP-binding protein
VLIGGRDVSDVPPKERDVSMVFQNYALYPYLTVAANIGFPLRVARVKKSERDKRVREVATLLGLENYLERKPANLSGGQRQRVAMGRAIVRNPSVFLMDEPLSNLDAKLRVQMRTEVSRLQKRLATTMVYVTHDQTEAMTLGDRVAVMRAGIIQQVAPPQELDRDPVNLFVAGFIGSPAMNRVEATVEGGEARFGNCRLALPAGSRLAGRVILGLRPHHLELAGPGTDAGLARLQGAVAVVEELGTETQLVVGIDAPRLRADAVRDALDAAPGDDVLLADEDRATLTAVVDPRTRAATGETVELAIDPARLHAFDPEPGSAIAVNGAPVAEHALA